MKLSNLLERLIAVRYAEYDPHAHRMCVLGYLGAMLELSQITTKQYLDAAFLADNAYTNRFRELRNAN